ncbi:type II secretion system F family protein [Myxococcota bacterium]|nr:type II secretion system F family protein [Myxococcota bacterium]MBU1379948.1 type II secretion system F family protein [Myxococcota bacterium]MBU1497074.1 type II secretion system F family protein [Myxococcota bacterium]
MPVYLWEGKAKDGSFKSGKITAANENAVYQTLGSQGINVSRLKEKPPFKWSDLGNIELSMGGIPPEDLMIFTRQFSTMLDAGLPLIQALEILANTSENKQFRKILSDVKDRVEQGATFSEALARHPKVFDNLFVNLVKAGEIGGVLDVIMGRMANHIEKNMKLRRRIKSAMSYPVIVLIVCVGVLGALIFKVIPTFEDMFQDMGGKSLPGLTQKIINISRWAIANSSIIFGGLGAIVVGFTVFLKMPRGKFLFHKALLYMPIIGSVIKKAAVARFSRTMGTLLSSGVPILDALEIVARSAGNLVIEEALISVREKISEGQNIVDPLIKTGIFPHMVVQMIGVGEQTGALDAMLNKIADFYEDEVDVAVEGMTSLIEPLLMVFLGGTVGVTMIAMYMPVFEMASAVKTE